MLLKAAVIYCTSWHSVQLFLSNAFLILFTRYDGWVVHFYSTEKHLREQEGWWVRVAFVSFYVCVDVTLWKNSNHFYQKRKMSQMLSVTNYDFFCFKKITFKFKAGLNTSALQGEFKSGIKTVKYVRESQTSQVILNGDFDRLVGSNLKITKQLS